MGQLFMDCIAISILPIGEPFTNRLDLSEQYERSLNAQDGGA